MQTLRDRWQVVKLGEVCELVGVTLNPKAFPEERFAHYSIPAFDEGQKPAIEPGAAILSNKVFFPNGAVLFSKLNPRIPRVWRVDDAHQYRRICSTEFLPLVPGVEVLCAEYLAFALEEPLLIHGLRACVAAATKSRERLKPEIVLNAEIPLPPLSEQKRIAAILKQQMAALETARRSAEAQLLAAEALPAAYLRAVFAGSEETRWPKTRLGDVIRQRQEIVHPHDKPKGRATFVGLEHIESATGRSIGSRDVEMSELTGRKPRFHKGDIVYGYLRPYLNKLWLAEFDGLCSVDQYVYEVDPEKADTSFIASFMRSPVYLERAPVNVTPGYLPRIRTEEVANVELNLPPVADQHRIAGQLSSQMSSAERLRQTLTELVNPQDLARLVVFDTWIRNRDRHPPLDSAWQPARRNVFLSVEDVPDGQLRLKAMDHTHCFTWAGSLTAKLAEIDEVQDERIYGRFAEFEAWIDRERIKRILDDLRMVGRGEIVQIVESIPAAWEVSQAARDAWVNLICQRAGWLTDNLPGLLWPQQEMNFENL